LAVAIVLVMVWCDAFGGIEHNSDGAWPDRLPPESNPLGGDGEWIAPLRRATSWAFEPTSKTGPAPTPKVSHPKVLV
jgi:hypothetical protein